MRGDALDRADSIAVKCLQFSVMVSTASVMGGPAKSFGSLGNRALRLLGTMARVGLEGAWVIGLNVDSMIPEVGDAGDREDTRR
jgi:acetyl-CoA carboxylase beta subunit